MRIVFRNAPARATAVMSIALLAALAAGCDDDSVRPLRKPPVPAVWGALAGLPTLYDFNAVQAVGPGAFVGVGRNGLAIYYDGVNWTSLYTETNTNLWAVWGPSFDDVVAVGDYGAVVQKSGPGLLLLSRPTSEHLRGVWGMGRNDFFVVGEAGVIFHYDGNGWTQMESNTTKPLFSVWGTANDNVFASGLDGTIVHHDGNGWTTMPSATGETLACVHGAGDSTVIAVGNDGAIVGYDGRSWQTHTSGTSDILQAVVVIARDRAIAVGGNGTALHWNGVEWTPMQNPTREWLFGITARGGDDVTAVGSHMVLHHDGDGWAAVTRGAAPTLRGAWSPSAGVAFAGGEDGTILRYAGGLWRRMATPTNRRINAIWGLSEGDVYAAGNAGRVMSLQGGAWVLELSLGPDYYDVGGRADDVVWVVGEGGRIVYRDIDTVWRVERTVTTRDLYGVWCPTPELTIAVGAAGEILEQTNGVWKRRGSPTAATLNGIGGYMDGRFQPVLRAYAVGDSGVVAQRVPETGAWERMESGVEITLYAVALGPDGAMYAGGAGGVVIRLDDDAWARFECPVSEDIYDLSRAPSGELFAVGGAGELSGIALLLAIE